MKPRNGEVVRRSIMLPVALLYLIPQPNKAMGAGKTHSAARMAFTYMVLGTSHSFTHSAYLRVGFYIL